jgi:hypothetical protein
LTGSIAMEIGRAAFCGVVVRNLRAGPGLEVAAFDACACGGGGVRVMEREKEALGGAGEAIVRFSA